MASAASRDRFLSIWPSLRDELVGYLTQEKMPAEAVKWFHDVSTLTHTSDPLSA